MKFSRKLQLEIQQMRRGAKFGLSCDDISLDVITISRWISADDAKRKREATRKIQQVACMPDARGSDVVLEAYPVASYSAISRCYLEIAKRCRLHKLIRQRFALALIIQQEDFALLFQQTKLQCIQSQRKASSRKNQQKDVAMDMISRRAFC
ncbi:hypothetical protein F511_14391 [Dorcoceras hygrometricum]|uniref:Uncharacterized protein n=1 Tax=Dorcoceras hygrometricum TaxID=472368 RepID=A0A2Z7BUX1_9LAMI|nr:hypothetical protein F511_14391 [Dorcoceras hygrometricum]